MKLGLGARIAKLAGKTLGHDEAFEIGSKVALMENTIALYQTRLAANGLSISSEMINMGTAKPKNT